MLVGRLRLRLRQPVGQQQNKMDIETQMFQPLLCLPEIPELFSGQLVSQLESLNALDQRSPGSAQKLLLGGAFA